MGALITGGEKDETFFVGGQAVIEGVMMRSPNSFAVSVRTPDGRIVVREDRWQSVWKRLKFLRRPFLRGGIVMIEALWNGISSLSFSAKWAGVDEESSEGKEKKGEAGSETEPDSQLSNLALVGTILFSFLLAVGLFVVFPHMVTALAGFPIDSWTFHAVDGVIKLLVLIAYVWGISLIPEIKRVFQYHGAEHMVIFTYERRLPLTVENARGFSTYHPRCGTSFLFMVLAVSILLFSFVLPFIPLSPDLNMVLKNLILIGIKIPLMLPVAGISYELIKLSGRRQDSALLRFITRPGLWLQRITTRKPTDDQLEVALLSLKKCLWREKLIHDSQEEPDGETRLYETFSKAMEAMT